ncbi:MAG: ribonuclease P protein component [Verrucomicrobia bacterium]|nr:ribonuclease P protein component [Verrucomicrobiota bacterium]
MANASLLAPASPQSVPESFKESSLSATSGSAVTLPAKKFPKSARILTSSHYKFLHRNSSRLFGEQISIDIRQGRSASPKLGLTVSKKFGKAHDRNRFKRVVREAFRELYTSLPDDLEMNISPRKSGANLSKHAILLELQALLARILRS